MSEYTIGIKTGDGQFYPILEENFKGKKRFILTTVNDNQTSVQIDFYRSRENKIDGSEYIGSLVIENIEPAQKRVPEIEVILGIDSENSLHAVARNLSSADNKQSLTVSLESLSSNLTYDMPEFELDDKLQPTTLFEDDQDLDDDGLTGETYPLDSGDSRKKHLEKNKTNPLFVFLFVIAGLLIIAAITFGIFSLCNRPGQEVQPPLEVQNTETPQQDESLAEQTAAENGKAEDTAAAETEQPGEVEEETTAEIKEEAVPTRAPEPTVVKKEEESKKKEPVSGGGYIYTIRSGDTLWDIAESVYNDPWLFKLIYENNKSLISHPDLIITGRQIYLPKK